MNDSMKRTLQTVSAVAALTMLVAGLSALAVVRADSRAGTLTAAGGGATSVGGANAPGGSSGTAGTVGTIAPGATPGATVDPVTGQAVPAADPAAAGAGDPAAGGGGEAAPGATSPVAGGQPTAVAAQGGPGPAAGGACTDENPDEGVFCDSFLVGGTTVLSGPLAIYGEQGLKGGQAWIEHFRRVIGPRDGVRSARLVFYDDGLDPNKTLQFTQRLVEVDKVLLIGGVTSPEAVAGYLDQKQVPMIGDIGLSPRSYSNDMIFPTAASYEVRADIRVAIAKKAYPTIKRIAVIQEILPGVDATPIDKGWEAAAKKHGVELAFYTSNLSSTDNTCNGNVLSALRAQPDFIFLPVAAPPMLACVSEANGKPGDPGPLANVKNWGGGSNLQFEVQQCGARCFGMFSAGTPFLDPRDNPSQNAKDYLANMAKYAPGVDVTGFIAINYYHAGLLQYEVMKQGGILNDLSRANVIKAAKSFGPFETGFGNTVQWGPEIPRIPTTCGYNVILDPAQKRWVFQKEKVCV